MNLHKNHKIIKIDDEEELKKENISIDNSTKEFDDKMIILTNLKNSIEHEMLEIEKSYEKVNKETTESFELKRKKINKEEQDLKEKLKNEVTKIKENLENNLSQTNNLFKVCEKIMKGIQIFEKEEKNMIKTLSYISKINKNLKEIDQLNQQLMKNLKITFDKKKGNIKYEEYYFNGLKENEPKKEIEKAKEEILTPKEIPILNVEHMDKVNKFRDDFGLCEDEYSNEYLYKILKKNNFDYERSFESLFD